MADQAQPSLFPELEPRTTEVVDITTDPTFDDEARQASRIGGNHPTLRDNTGNDSEDLADVVDLNGARLQKEIDAGKAIHPGFAMLSSGESLVGEPDDVNREWQAMRVVAKARGAIAVAPTQDEQIANARRAEAEHRELVPKQILDRNT